MTAPQNFGNATGKPILVLVPQFPPCLYADCYVIIGRLRKL
nr:MAG TPA: hypothetical protein [Caudoviricetes sp.]